jgi:DNA polymerase processivity factor./gp45 sliding clamp, C terminal.
MKLSDFMLSGLKNFSAISTSILLRPGKVQKTLAQDLTIYVEAEFEDEMPSEFGIFDLNQFLGNITTLNKPDLKFDNNHVVISDDVMTMMYRACPAELIETVPPEKQLRMKTVDVSFQLSGVNLQRLLKLATMNGFEHISITGDGEKIYLIGHNRDDNESNSVKTVVGESQREPFRVSFHTDLLRLLMNDDYQVDVELNRLTRFESVNHKIHYFVSPVKKEKA